MNTFRTLLPAACACLALMVGGCGGSDEPAAPIVQSDPDVRMPTDPAPVPQPDPPPVQVADKDFDGVSDATDNCPDSFNPNQADADGDNLGDVCDAALPIADASSPLGYVMAEARSGSYYVNGVRVDDAQVLSSASLRRDFNIFDYDGPGIGRNRECSVDSIDCTPTRDCTFSSVDCTPTRDCGNLELQRDTRDCSACVLRNIFTGGCSIRGNDPVCEVSKATQNALYDADYAARKLDCERIKAQDKAFCEADKAARKLDCERIKAQDKLVCEADKSAKKLDCERLKETQAAVGELWEAEIHESKNQALRENPRPIPDRIRRALQPYFSDDILNSVVWTDDHGNVFSWAKVATEIDGRGAITFDNVIVFKSEGHAQYDVGLWAHELEHVKQYRLLGIDAFAEYYADYFIDEYLTFDGRFTTGRSPTPAEVEAYVAGKKNKLEALASVQSHHVCSLIDPYETHASHWAAGQVIDRWVDGTCRPN